jgi:hypothetical protein
VLCESAIIIEYIEDAFPIPPLMLKVSGRPRRNLASGVLVQSVLCKPDIDRFQIWVSRFTSEECGMGSKLTSGHLGKL